MLPLPQSFTVAWRAACSSSTLGVDEYTGQTMTTTSALRPPIRVGLIRCDTHGAYYGALMAPHDPLRLRSPLTAGAPARYSWQTGGAHFYFYTNYADPGQMTVDFVGGFRLARVWDEYPDAAASLAAVFDDPPRVCRSFAEASDDVDLVFIADCNGDGSDHLSLARPGLEKGVATFVDKPLAYTIEEARAIVELAAERGAPFASASILQALPAAAQFGDRLEEVGELQFGTVQGGGLTLAGQIHTVCLALHIFGDGVRGVRAMGDGAPHTIHLDYGQRPDRPRLRFGPAAASLSAATSVGSGTAPFTPVPTDRREPFTLRPWAISSFPSAPPPSCVR